MGAAAKTTPLGEHVRARAQKAVVRRLPLDLKRSFASILVGLAVLVVIAPREQLVRRRRARKPRPNVSIEPSVLLMRSMRGHEWAEAVRTDIARHDQEIACRSCVQGSGYSAAKAWPQSYSKCGDSCHFLNILGE